MIQYHPVDLRTRLANRNRSSRQQTIPDRIAEAQRDSQRLLLNRAHQMSMTAEPDYMKPGYWVTRHSAGGDSGRARGQINLTSRTTCSCSEFGTWHRCPCIALVTDMEAVAQVDAA